MSALTVADIFRRVQTSFGDESAVQVTEQKVIDWINDAQREAVMQHEGLLMTTGTLSSVANQGEYALPSNCFTLLHVKYRDSDDASYYALRFMPSVEMNVYIAGWDGPDYHSGYPQVFTKIGDDKIGLFPRPDRSLAGNIQLVYARYANDLTASTDPIDLPHYYHSYVEHFCMMKAYEMDEDWEAAQQKAAVLQSTLNFNNSREAWFGRESYPSVTPMPEDYYG